MTVSISTDAHAADAADAADTDGAGQGSGVWRGGGGEVRDVFGLGVLGADGGYARVGGFAGFGEGVVA